MTDEALGIYIHWPFCLSKCPYCDFNSHVGGNSDPQEWGDAFSAELKRYANETLDRVVKTVFFGGGTPSLMEPALVGRILETINKTWKTVDDIEVTLEANPTSVEAGRFRDYSAAGVNRVSVGIQSLNDKHLKQLGRMHSAAEALLALDVAQQCFDRVSFDLIYARQDQTLTDWQVELNRALAMGTGHLSLYQLTVEPETVFGKRHALGQLSGLPDDDLSADMYELTQEMTEAANLPAYEVSNHARPGMESRHNLTYWTGGDFLGIGPGAHGRLTVENTRFATESPLNPKIWLEQVANGSGESVCASLSRDEQFHERVLMGLRLVDGIPLGLLEHGEVNHSKINALVDSGHLSKSNSHLAATRLGRMVLNRIILEILS